MGNRVTIKDVAREANVSIKTVSNVLNDTGSMRPDTRRRVEEVMRKLGYTVNFGACNAIWRHKAYWTQHLRFLAAVRSFFH